MAIEVTPHAAPCGAEVRGVDLSAQLAAGDIDDIRAAWLRHQVLDFPDQAMGLADLERFAATIGPFGVDPYFESVPGHPHVAEVRREADEQTTIFAENWHSDWSFLASPPAATLLYGDDIPPVGGDTLFAEQYGAWETLPAALRAQVAGRMGVHSARLDMAGRDLAQDETLGLNSAWYADILTTLTDG